MVATVLACDPELSAQLRGPVLGLICLPSPRSTSTRPRVAMAWTFSRKGVRRSQHRDGNKSNLSTGYINPCDVIDDRMATR